MTSPTNYITEAQIGDAIDQTQAALDKTSCNIIARHFILSRAPLAALVAKHFQDNGYKCELKQDYYMTMPIARLLITKP